MDTIPGALPFDSNTRCFIRLGLIAAFDSGSHVVMPFDTVTRRPKR
jgi:hypothetical protein